MATQDKIRDEKLKLIIINSIAAMILTEKQQKHHDYHQKKLININIL